MRISDLGEFGLIDMLARIAPQGGPEHRVLIGIGDDAAAWQCEGPAVLATTDAMVQGVHFTPGTPWRELGWKALAVNLSDIAAMGGVPRYALVNLSLPLDMEVEDVARLYRGMAELADQHRVAIVGGNVTGAPAAMIAVTVIGQALPEGLLRRSAAVPGDVVAVTGYLGMAAAGLRVLRGDLRLRSGSGDSLRRAHLQPQPRVAEGQALVRGGVRAAIDISDGLVADLSHVCAASRVGAHLRLGDLPVHPQVREALGEKAADLALSGGEDYELLFTAADRVVQEVKKALDGVCPVTAIGEVTEGTRVGLLGGDGKPYYIYDRGWDHFGKGDRE